MHPRISGHSVPSFKAMGWHFSIRQTAQTLGFADLLQWLWAKLSSPQTSSSSAALTATTKAIAKRAKMAAYFMMIFFFFAKT
jgi:hypothetical protein